MTYPGGEEAKYTYYNDGLMHTMTFTSSSGGTGYTWEYKYDSYGRLSNIKRPDGTKEERIYDEAGKLIEQIDKKGTSTEVQRNKYTYNTFGEIITKTTSQTGNLDKLEVVEMTYNDANRLETYNGQPVQYDPKGNMTYGPVNGDMSTLSYDSRNRLTSAGGVSYEYDAENNRISSTENGLTTEYVTDSSGSLSRLLVAYEPDNTQTFYVYGAEGLAGQYNTGTGERLYYHFDNIGSTTCVTDQTGAVVEAFAYGTYGELLTQPKRNIRFLYNGSYGVMTDSNGLYYMRARYYNPDIKRFINQDIKVGDISNSQSLNRYAYCEGNPVSLIDPFGLSPQTSQDQTKESKFQWLHNTLDVAGLFFDGADAINAVLYAAEGDWKNAALCAVSVVPLVGSAVVGVVKGAKAIAKAKKAAKITELAQESMKLTKNAGNALDTLHDTMSVSTKWGNNPLKIADGMAVKSGTDIAKVLETGGDIGTQANKAVDSIKSVASSDGWRLSTKADETADVLKTTNTGGVGGCFVAGTKVKTAEGERNIEDIEVGDYVLAENAETGEQEYKQVVKTFIHEKTTLVHVYVGDEEIETTLEHPFYVEGFGFVPAGELQVGDIIRTSDGRKLPIKKVEIEELEGTVLVYNLEVEDFHTYYVSDLGVLVHNMCAVSTSGRTTGENSKILSKNLAKEGRPVGENQAAAHIVASTGSKRQWEAAVDSRKLLSKYNININDAANGIPAGQPRPHNLTHNRAFHEMVNYRLHLVETNMQNSGYGRKSIRSALRRELRKIGKEFEYEFGN